MKSELAGWLADPVGKSALTLEIEESTSSEVVKGSLSADDGRVYPIVRGIPRFVITEDEDQLQTRDAFAYKWGKRDTYDSQGSRRTTTRWLVDKYGFASADDWAGYYDSRDRILDVGCGGGFSSSLWLRNDRWTGKAAWVGADISEAVDVAASRLSEIPSTHFVQADALSLPFPDGAFDTVFSEGVLHHTPSTRDALLDASRVLADGGEIHFYVYRKKGPVREFTDDCIRAAISDCSEAEAWDAMRSLTELGRKLSELHATIELEKGVPLLGIPAGTHDVQRLVYWYFAKMYWNDDVTFEENVHVNYDWYRPHYAHRHTAEEVRAWCREASLEIDLFHEQEAGFTVRATKRGR